MVASSVTPVGSEIDLFMPWLRHFLAFGSTYVEIVAADGALTARRR